MAETFEEQYEDVLQNIEFALAQVYRAHPEMTDFEALDAVQALVRTYQSETRRQLAPPLKLKPLAQESYDSVKAACEWRLGREHMLDEKDRPLDLEMTPKTADEIVLCLKRIRRSIETWNKRGGRRGYFDFVQQFLP
jgi:hypothetical protein